MSRGVAAPAGAAHLGAQGPDADPAAPRPLEARLDGGDLLLDLPLGGTVTASLLWTAGILVVFAPLAVRADRRQA